MVRSVAVPLDGSRFAESALRPAVRIARAAKARLRLVAVHEPHMALVPAADIPASGAPDDPELRSRLAEYMDGESTRLSGAGCGPVTDDVVDGLAGPALSEWITRSGVDLVVMATHGRGPLSRLWLGSVADHVIRHVSVPVLLLRPADGEEPGDQGMIRLGSALVPLDLSDESEAILESLKDFANLFDTHLTLLHVVEPFLGAAEGSPSYPATVCEDLVSRNLYEAQRHLDQIADRLREKGVRVATRVVQAAGIAGAVLNQLREPRFDFVALTTHGAAGLRRIVLGGVADKIVRGAHRPVLVLRPAPGA